MPAIEIKPRSNASKNEAKRLRRGGNIPFILYSNSGDSIVGALPTTDFVSVLRKLRPGFLPTTVFELKSEDGKIRKALVKDIQYKPTTYEVIHLDFIELIPNVKVKVKVPVEHLNTVDCVGVKSGGFLRTVTRHVRVECLPEDLPTHFEIDVRELNMRQLKRVSDIQMPKGVASLHKTDDILVTIVKR